MSMLQGNLGPFLHLGLPVLDLVKVKNWYRDVLDYQIIHEPVVEFDNQIIHISFLKRDEFVLEFYELLDIEKQDYWTRKKGFLD